MSKLFNFLLFILVSVLGIQVINGTARSPNCLEPFKDQSSSGCMGFIPRYYYDVKNDECILFIYGGCGGNLNNFESKEECEYSCDVQPKVVDALNGVQSDMSPCLVPHEATRRCLGYVPRFYYDKDANKCVFFIYGGCGGSANNFASQEECEQTCDVQPKVEDNSVLSLADQFKPRFGGGQRDHNWHWPEEVQSDSNLSPCLQRHEGDRQCLASIPRYYYDKKNSECFPFIYGGCGGTANNFLTKEECEKTCDVKPKEKVQEEVSPCLRSHIGQLECLAFIPRFYYDTKNNECVSFIYGGCDPTPNNFISKEECEKFCLVVPERRTKLRRKQIQALRSRMANKMNFNWKH